MARLFSADWYRRRYLADADPAIDPLAYYVRTGAKLGHDPHPLFDARYYRRHVADKTLDGVGALLHYLRAGGSATNDPHPLFDTQYYLKQRPDAGTGAATPLEHFLSSGPRSGVSAHPLFDSAWYLSRYTDLDLEAHGIVPLHHYVIAGAREERAPHPLFDPAWYCDQHPQLRMQATVSPLEHFVRAGPLSRFDPHPLFRSGWYLDHCPDVDFATMGLLPLQHYVTQGSREGRDPHPLFSAEWYVRQHPECETASKTALEHFLAGGPASGYDPHPLFASSWYIARNRDIAAADVIPLRHYVESGARENRDPHPLFDTAWYRQHAAIDDAGKSALEQYLDAGPHGSSDPHPLFANTWYATTMSELDVRPRAPLLDYCMLGAGEGRSPHPLIDGNWYLKQHPELVGSTTSALEHLLESGAESGISPHPLFDSARYLTLYPDLQLGAVGMVPLQHYLLHGAREGRSPHALFDTGFYLGQFPDLRGGETAPLLHFLLAGPASDIDPNPLFSSRWYRASNPDVASAGVNPLQHYCDGGWREGRDPHPLFSVGWYLAQSDTVAAADAEPLDHFLTSGAREGRDPHPLFDTRWYLAQHPDLPGPGLEAVLSFIDRGGIDRRDPNILFSSRWYSSSNPDIATSGLNPLLHYIEFGAAEGRRTHPFFGYPEASLEHGSWRHLALYLRGPFARLVGRIEDACVFDANWYASQLGDAPKPANPIAHYLVYGRRLGLSPHPLFDGDWYLLRYADIDGVDPLVHYIEFGAGEGRQPGPMVEPAWFLAHRGREDHADLNPLTFFNRFGFGSAEASTPLFDAKWYEAQNPEVALSGYSPMMHFVLFGQHKDLDPHPIFSARWYRETYAEAMARSTFSVFRHFTAFQHLPNVNPGPFFDGDWYLETYKDIANSGIAALTHYLDTGRTEGRQTFAIRAGMRVAVILHAFYPDLLPQIRRALRSIECDFDLYITYPDDASPELLTKINRLRPGSRLIPCANVGFDIAPFFDALKAVRASGIEYDAVCKIHTKKGRTEPDTWRYLLLTSVLGSKALVRTILRGFSADHRLSLVGARAFYLDGETFSADNLLHVRALERGLRDGTRPLRTWGFFAGTMFWFKLHAFDRLAELVERDHVFDEDARTDGGLAHALERAFGLSAAVERAQIGLIDIDAQGDATWTCRLQSADAETTREPPHLYLARMADLLREKLAALATASGPVRSGRVWVPDPLDARRVRFLSPVKVLNGLGVSARGYLKTLQRSEIPVSVNDWRLGFDRLRTVELDVPDDGAGQIQITHLNLDLLHNVETVSPRNFQDLVDPRRYNVLIPYFELLSLKPEWLSVLALFDEAWCASSFLQRALNAASPIRTRILRPAVLPEDVDVRLPRDHFGLPSQRFVFGYFADAGSVLDRKNPLAFVESFAAEFDESEGACCFIKIHYSSREHEVISRIREIAAERHDILFSDALYTDREMASLVASLDSYVSPHRAEGLGLTIIEAMHAAVPVIATKFGGAIDMLDDEVSLGLPYRLVEVGPGNAPYGETYTWADPDRGAIRSSMRKLFDDRDHARALGLKGREHVRDLFGLDATASAVRSALLSIWETSAAASTR